MQTIDREITQEVPLCDERGFLNPEAKGWSRRPLHVGNLKGRPLRKKKWNYWCVTGDRFLISAVVAHVDYFALGAFYIFEYDTQRYAESGWVKPFSRAVNMPETVGGDIRFASSRIDIRLNTHDDETHMDVAVKRLGGRPCTAKLVVARPPSHETLNVLVPWDERTFQFTSKQHCLPTSGTVTWGEEEFVFDPETASATLDYGRGIWPYFTTWNWGAFSVRNGDDSLGVNLGGQWTDGTGMNENGVVLNGVLHKIFDDVVFEYDRKNFMAPWRVRSKSSDTVDLEFVPFYQRAGKVPLLILSSKANQCFGHYTGTLRVAGHEIPVDKALGWAEEHIARW